jgi:hypothetical protein
MGTYFVLAEQINRLADRLDDRQLEALFNKAHQPERPKNGGDVSGVKVQASR